MANGEKSKVEQKCLKMEDILDKFTYEEEESPPTTQKKDINSSGITGGVKNVGDILN